MTEPPNTAALLTMTSLALGAELVNLARQCLGEIHRALLECGALFVCDGAAFLQKVDGLLLFFFHQLLQVHLSDVPVAGSDRPCRLTGARARAVSAATADTTTMMFSLRIDPALEHAC